MLFNSTLANLSANVQSLQAKIDEFEAILKQLRNEKSALEAEIQSVKTLEGAAESAIAQSTNFIGAAESLQRADLIETFWQAMEALKGNAAIASLPESNDAPQQVEPLVTPPPANNNDASDSETIVEIDIATPTVEQFVKSAKPVAKTVTVTPALQEVSQPPVNAGGFASIEDLRVLGRPALLSLAAKKLPRIAGKERQKMTADDLANALAATVTPDELKQFVSQRS